MENTNKQLCLYCRGTGYFITERVGRLVTTVDCPVGCEEADGYVKEFADQLSSRAKAQVECDDPWSFYADDTEEDPAPLNNYTEQDDPC